MTHTIGMISLGCAKNQVNAEHMLWLLRQAGYEISPDPDGAELVIVNTCGFIESAKTEAIDNILAMAQLKAEGRIQKILVTGCLAQRYQEEILQEMPEVDGVLGTGSYFDVANAVGQVLSGKRYKRFDDINADQMRLCAFVQLMLRGCVEIQEQRRFAPSENDAVGTRYLLPPRAAGRFEPRAELSHLRDDPLRDLLPDRFARRPVICFCDGCNDCKICS